MRVLLVEDEPSLREGMADLISELAEVREAGTVADALKTLDAERFALVLTDLRIAGAERGGRDIVEAAQQRLQPVTIVSAAQAEEVARALRPYEPDAVLAKPFQLEALLEVVELFLKLRRDTEQLATARALPPESAWTELAPGVRVARASSQGRALAWVRMSPGASLSFEGFHRSAEGAFVVEGDLEVDGQPRAASQYLYLRGAPHQARTREGCLLVSLALRS